MILGLLELFIMEIENLLFGGVMGRLCVKINDVWYVRWLDNGQDRYKEADEKSSRLYEEIVAKTNQ